MQGGVIRGIFLCAFLLSASKTQELNDSKQLEDSKIADHKDTSVSIEESSQNSVNDANSSNEGNNVKTDISAPEIGSNSSENQSQTSSDTKNEQQNVESTDPSSSSDKSDNPSERTSSETAETKIEPQLIAYPQALPLKQHAIQLNSHFKESSLDSGQKSQNDEQEKLHGSSSKEQSPLFSAPDFDALNVPSYLNPKKPEYEQPEKTSEEVKPDAMILGMDLVPPLYSSHIKAMQSPPKPISKEIFSPLFSSPPVVGQADIVQHLPQNNGFSPISLYSHESRNGFEERRSNDDIQVRNADERQYSDTMNSYPFNPNIKSDSKDSDERSGAPMFHSEQGPVISAAQAYAGTQDPYMNILDAHNQGLNPYSYGYPPASSPGSSASAQALAMSPSGGSASAQSSTMVIEDGKSRVIWPHEYIFPHKILGGDNVVQCTRENEFHHFWARGFNCLVCICLNEYGLLQPVCASCSGCQYPAPPEPPPFIPPTPEPHFPSPTVKPHVPSTPNPDPFKPPSSAPSLIIEPTYEGNIDFTTPLPIREVPATCSPLPMGQTFTNPLHPCQICICKEIVNESGKFEVIIECQDSPHCVLPFDVTTLPPIPDVPVPVPLPLCEKFPPHVLFPHPSENCKQCQCSIQLSAFGVPEQQITCVYDASCGPKTEHPPELTTRPAPFLPIPVEPYPGPEPKPPKEPVPENYPEPKPPLIPEQPIPWPPITTTPSPSPPSTPKGPLPGPSPHESCRPYPPNQVFQHPWDECQVCQCTESFGVGVVNVEVSCFTKLSCCIESPQQAVSAIAGKTNSESGAGTLAANQVPNAVYPITQQGGLKPYVPTIPSFVHSANRPTLGSFQSTNAISSAITGGGQSLADASAENYFQGSLYPYVGNSQTGTYSIAQTSQNNIGYPGSYQSANSYSDATNSGGQSSAQAYSDNFPQGTIYPMNTANANAIAQSSQSNSGRPEPEFYQTANAISIAEGGVGSSQSQAEANAEKYSPGSNRPNNIGAPQITSVSGSSDTLTSSQNDAGSYQPTNAYGNALNTADGSQNLAGASTENYSPGSFNPQSGGSADTLASYQGSGSYPSSNAYGNAESSESQTVLEANAESNVPSTSSVNQPGSYNPSSTQNQAYSESNAQNDNQPSESDFNKPATRNLQNIFGPYGQYPAYSGVYAPNQNFFTNPIYPTTGLYIPTNAGSYTNIGSPADPNEENTLPFYNPSQHLGYTEEHAQRKKLYTTNKPTLYGSYNSEVAQNLAFAEAASQFKELTGNTQKPSNLISQYNQNQNLVQGNAQHSALRTTTPRPVYSQYNPGIGGILTITDKPLPLYNPYPTGLSQNLAYAGASALAQNSLNSYYMPKSYQAANALSSASADQSSAIAGALAQSQAYNPYVQQAISKPSTFNPYQTNYYKGYPSPQSPYSGRPDQGLDAYQPVPIYTGNYDLNGKADAVNVLNSPDAYSPYGPGLSQSQFIPTSNYYSSTYPKLNSYEMNSMYRPAQFSAANAEALATNKIQTKSGEGYPEE